MGCEFMDPGTILFKKQNKLAELVKKTRLFAENLVCIDIGFRNIKVLESKIWEGKDVFIRDYGIVATPRGCIKNGAINDVSKVIYAIEKVLQENRIKTKNTKIVMSGTSIITRVLIVEIPLHADKKSAIEHSIAENIPVNMENYQLNYKVLEESHRGNTVMLKVFVTVVRKSIIKSYIDVVRGLGLKPLSIDIPSNSIAKFFRREINVDRVPRKPHQIENNVFAVLDFGSETTIVNIFKDKVLEFNRVVLLGSSNIDEIIARALDRSIEESERLKKMYGIAPLGFNPSPDQKAMYEPVKSFIDKIVTQIKLCFEFYVKRCYGQSVSQIYVIGGGSLLKGLQEYLQDSLDVPVYPIGLLSIDNIEIDPKLDVGRLNYLINSIGIALDA